MSPVVPDLPLRAVVAVERSFGVGFDHAARDVGGLPEFQVADVGGVRHVLNVLVDGLDGPAVADVEFEGTVTLADVPVDDLDGLTRRELGRQVGFPVPQRHSDPAGRVAEDQVRDAALRSVVAVERAHGVGAEHAPREIHVREAEREVLDPVGVGRLHVDLRVGCGFGLVDVDFEAVVAVLRAAGHTEGVPRFEPVDRVVGHPVPHRDRGPAGLVGDVDVDDAAVVVRVVALEGPEVADPHHLREELHVVHPGVDVGDPLNLLVSELVGDQHRRGLLVGEPPHLFDLVLDGGLELLEVDVGVEVLVHVFDHTHPGDTPRDSVPNRKPAVRAVAASGISTAKAGRRLSVVLSRVVRRCGAFWPRSAVAAPGDSPSGRGSHRGIGRLVAPRYKNVRGPGRSRRLPADRHRVMSATVRRPSTSSWTTVTLVGGSASSIRTS